MLKISFLRKISTNILNRKYSNKIKNYLEDTKYIFEQYDKRRFTNYPNIPVFKIALGCGIFSLFSFGGYLIFKENVHLYLSNQGSEIAGNIVNSEDVKISVNKLIDDPEMTEVINKLSVEVINKLCEDDEIKESLANLVIDVFNRKDVQDEFTKCIIDILNQDIIYKELNSIIKQTIQDKENIEQINKLVSKVVKSNDTIKSVKEFIYNLIFKR